MSYQGLKDFTDLSITNLKNFIETNTNNEYTVVKRRMVCELNQQLLENNIILINIQNFLNNLWDQNNKNPNTKDLVNHIEFFLTKEWMKVLNSNSFIVDKWEDDLIDFKVHASSR